jgi:hypothetical protein
MYPELDDPHFSSKIFDKKEFNKFQSIKNQIEGKTYDDIVKQECSLNRPFRLTPNQIMLRNYISPLTPYNGILLFHGLGVGKTCTAITIAEQFTNVFSNPITVITPNSLKDNFVQQLKGFCGMRKHSQEATDKYINSKYKFYGYGEFASEVDVIKMANWNRYGEIDETRFSEEYRNDIRNKYSNRVFILDEVHNVRSKNEETDKKNPKLIRDVFHFAENVKLILLSATPMYDSAREIIWLLNYLLANDKRPIIDDANDGNDVFDKHGNLKNKKSIQILNEASRGYVSYMRGENPFSFPMIFYPKDRKLVNLHLPKKEFINGNIIKDGIQDLKDKLYISYFSPFQSRIYNKQLLKKYQQTLAATPRQLANITFPCGEVTDDTNNEDNTEETYGKTAFMKCFKSTYSKGNTRFSYKITPFLTPNSLGKYSCKMNSIVDKILSSEGTVLVYSFYVHSGVLPLAIALEHRGFKRSLNAPSLLTNVQDLPPYAGTYSLLTGDSQFNMNNSDELKEINAGRVKVVIGTSIASEGLDLKNIREVHIMEPHFHLNKIKQVVGRAQRKCSHVSLPPSKRNLTVYLHTAIDPSDPETETVDMWMYRMGEKKQVTMDKVQNILIQNSIDYELNWSYNFDKTTYILHQVETSQGNVLHNVNIQDHLGMLKDSSNSQKQSPKLTLNFDDSTFDEYFLSEELNELVREIRNYFWKHVKGTVDEISKFTGTDKELISYALHQMVIQGMDVVRKHNHRGYLIKTVDQIFLFHPDGVDPDMYLTDEQRIGLDQINTPQQLVLLSNDSKNEVSGNITERIEQLKIPFKEELLKNNYDAFVDFIVDRTKDFREIENIPVFRKSLLSAGYLFAYIDEKGSERWVLNNHGNYMVKNPDNQTWRHADPLEIGQLIKPPPPKSLENALGYFYMRPQSRAGLFFVIHKQNNKGTECGNGEMSKKVLYKKIHNLSGRTFDYEEMTKKQLCRLYEILLRVESYNNPTIFVRKI